MSNYFLNITLLAITIGISACSDNSSNTNVKKDDMIKGAEFCMYAGQEARMAVVAHDSGVTLEVGLKDIDTRHQKDLYMLSYAKNIWTGIYKNIEEFTPDSAEQIAKDICFTKMTEYAAAKDDSDPGTFKCKIIAEQIKKMAIFRDKGLTYDKFRSKIMKSSKKGNPLLKSYDMEGEAVAEMLNALDYIYSNKEKTPDDIYNIYLSRCLSTSKN